MEIIIGLFVFISIAVTITDIIYKNESMADNNETKTERERTLMLARVNIKIIHRHRFQVIVGKTIDKHDYSETRRERKTRRTCYK